MKFKYFLISFNILRTASAIPQPDVAAVLANTENANIPQLLARAAASVSSTLLPSSVTVPGAHRKHSERPKPVKTWNTDAYGNFPTSLPNLPIFNNALVRNATNSTSLDSKKNLNVPNGPQHRGNWLPGYDINTDAYQKWPETGRVVSTHFFIQNKTLSPDGTPKQMLVVNGQYPGPTLEANWGDWIEVTVHNELKYNGTSMHWHGFRQLNTNTEDGTPGVTECPIAPGKSKTYRFQATQYGTSWYHSHFSKQFGDGVIGPIIIHGPSSANWDIDLGTVMINDWYDMTISQEGAYADLNGPPDAVNYLLNGKNVKPDGSAGQRATWKFQPGKKHLMRFVNSGANNHFKLQLDGHTFTVIQNDFVPIIPYQTQELSINIGQRYDVIVQANQPVGNYYLRALNAPECGRINNDGTGIANGIVRYIGAPAGLPIVNDPVFVLNPQCDDEPLSSLVPVVPKAVDPTGFVEQFRTLPVQLGGATLATGENVFVWYLNGISANVDWTLPTVETVANNRTIASARNSSVYFPDEYNIISLPNEGQWTFWVIQNELYIPHPIHLHGHDFAVLGQGDGFFDPTYHYDLLNFTSPNRRDVATLRQNGWTVMAFQADNPGSWLMHCHIIWHNAEGLSLQFLELPSKIPTTYGSKVNSKAFQDNCNNFDKYFGGPQDIYGKKDVGT